jgi:hypothetical protein
MQLGLSIHQCCHGYNGLVCPTRKLTTSVANEQVELNRTEFVK